MPTRVDGHRGHAPRHEPLASCATGQSFGRTRAMKPNPHDEIADRAAEERSEDDGMAEHPAKARDPARWAAERRERSGQRAPASGARIRPHRRGRPRHGVVRRPGGARFRPRRVSAAGSGGKGGDLSGEAPHDDARHRCFPRTAAGVHARSGLRARPLVLRPAVLGAGAGRRRAAERAQERETQEEVAPCRVVTGETGAPAGRTTMGVCARAIQAGSGAGTWGPYAFEVDRDGRVHVNGEYVGVMRRTDLPTIDPGRR